jgi:hypothetical protein
MKITAKFAAAAFGAIAFSSAAFAGSVTQPGETVGFDAATPLPEGVYFESTQSIGTRDVSAANGGGYTESGVGIPLLAWSTPWQILGGRLVFLYAQPELYSGYHSHTAGLSTFNSGLYNPFLAATLQWNLGNGFSAAYLAGAYIGINSGDFAPGFNQNTFRQDLSLAWHGNGWNATANLIFGLVGDNGTTSYFFRQNPDFFNYDLALTKTLGKWEIGVVGFGSTDVGAPRRPVGFPYAQQSQFALGGLIGYNFGPVISQLYVTTDVYQHNYSGNETRIWNRVIVPLWSPEAPKVVTAKY